MKKIIIISTKYHHSDGSSWLVSELANSISNKGYDVSVINLDWNYLKNIEVNNEINFINLLPFKFFGRWGIAGKWLFSSLKILPIYLKLYRKKGKFDLLINFSPCASAGLSIIFQKLIVKTSLLIYWDFFPLHNFQIKHGYSSKLIKFLKIYEQFLIKKHNMIALMTEKNKYFFYKYYDRLNEKKTFEMPIWTSFLENKKNKNHRSDFGLDLNSIIFVFGGQLTAGRAILEMCAAFERAYEFNKSVRIVICGDGPLKKEVQKYHLRSKGVIYLGSLSRFDYLKLLSSSDVGVISNAKTSDISSFPSKSLDYMASYLPIMAAIEDESDFRDVVIDEKMGFCCEAENVDEICSLALKIADDQLNLIDMGNRANEYLKKNHAVDEVVDEIFSKEVWNV